jgi:Prokaryotic diacylglycerol kinase
METRPFQFAGRIRSFGHATALEFLADAASPNFHPVVRDAKDVSAGAVLISALAISDRRNHFLASCDGFVEALTRSTHAEIFVMSSEYASPTHLLLFSRQTNS